MRLYTKPINIAEHVCKDFSALAPNALPPQSGPQQWSSNDQKEVPKTGRKFEGKKISTPYTNNPINPPSSSSPHSNQRGRPWAEDVGSAGISWALTRVRQGDIGSSQGFTPSPPSRLARALGRSASSFQLSQPSLGQSNPSLSPAHRPST